jgi:8-oxo-dGTP pyrophosphatase MutT (NUDIX family)
MHRQSLIDLLNQYQPWDAQEIVYKTQILDFVKKYPNCFDRELQIGHVTASAFILNQDHTKALLLHHKKLDSWFQLGGHCDGDSDVLRVAIKEAQEESGISEIAPLSLQIFDIDIHTIPANRHEPEHDHYDIRFLLHVTSDAQVVQNHESKQLLWVGNDVSQLPTKQPSVLRMFYKWQNMSLI